VQVRTSPRIRGPGDLSIWVFPTGLAQGATWGLGRAPFPTERDGEVGAGSRACFADRWLQIDRLLHLRARWRGLQEGGLWRGANACVCLCALEMASWGQCQVQRSQGWRFGGAVRVDR
jgi:hypothetical protein